MKKITLALLTSIFLVSNANALEYNYDSCDSTLLLAGKIELNDGIIFSRLLKGTHIEKIYIHSNGGYTRAAFRMMNVLSQYTNGSGDKPELIVDGNSMCLSACAYLVLGYTNSFVDPDSNFAIHMPRIPRSKGQTLQESIEENKRSNKITLDIWERYAHPTKAFLRLMKKAGQRYLPLSVIKRHGFDHVNFVNVHNFQRTCK